MANHHAKVHVHKQSSRDVGAKQSNQGARGDADEMQRDPSSSPGRDGETETNADANDQNSHGDADEDETCERKDMRVNFFELGGNVTEMNGRDLYKAK